MGTTWNGEDGDPACWSWPLPNEPIPTDEIEQRRLLRTWQAKRCGICGGEATCEDHDYVTGLTRGWLCSSCNNREARISAPDSVYARWRACPASAVLGVRIQYAPPDPWRDWTGSTYLPDWAPPHNGWPHAYTAGPRPLTMPAWFGEAAAVMDDEWVRIVGDRN